MKTFHSLIIFLLETGIVLLGFSVFENVLRPFVRFSDVSCVWAQVLMSEQQVSSEQEFQNDSLQNKKTRLLDKTPSATEQLKSQQILDPIWQSENFECWIFKETLENSDVVLIQRLSDIGFFDLAEKKSVQCLMSVGSSDDYKTRLAKQLEQGTVLLRLYFLRWPQAFGEERTAVLQKEKRLIEQLERQIEDYVDRQAPTLTAFLPEDELLISKIFAFRYEYLSSEIKRCELLREEKQTLLFKNTELFQKNESEQILKILQEKMRQTAEKAEIFRVECERLSRQTHCRRPLLPLGGQYELNAVILTCQFLRSQAVIQQALLASGAERERFFQSALTLLESGKRSLFSTISDKPFLSKTEIASQLKGNNFRLFCLFELARIRCFRLMNRFESASDAVRGLLPLTLDEIAVSSSEPLNNSRSASFSPSNTSNLTENQNLTNNQNLVDNQNSDNRQNTSDFNNLNQQSESDRYFLILEKNKLALMLKTEEFRLLLAEKKWEETLPLLKAAERDLLGNSFVFYADSLFSEAEKKDFEWCSAEDIESDYHLAILETILRLQENLTQNTENSAISMPNNNWSEILKKNFLSEQDLKVLTLSSTKKIRRFGRPDWELRLTFRLSESGNEYGRFEIWEGLAEKAWVDHQYLKALELYDQAFRAAMLNSSRADAFRLGGRSLGMLELLIQETLLERGRTDFSDPFFSGSSLISDVNISNMDDLSRDKKNIDAFNSADSHPGLLNSDQFLSGDVYSSSSAGEEQRSDISGPEIPNLEKSDLEISDAENSDAGTSNLKSSKLRFKPRPSKTEQIQLTEQKTEQTDQNQSVVQNIGEVDNSDRFNNIGEIDNKEQSGIRTGKNQELRSLDILKTERKKHWEQTRIRFRRLLSDSWLPKSDQLGQIDRIDQIERLGQTNPTAQMGQTSQLVQTDQIDQLDQTVQTDQLGQTGQPGQLELRRSESVQFESNRSSANLSKSNRSISESLENESFEQIADICLDLLRLVQIRRIEIFLREFPEESKKDALNLSLSLYRLDLLRQRLIDGKIDRNTLIEERRTHLQNFEVFENRSNFIFSTAMLMLEEHRFSDALTQFSQITNDDPLDFEVLSKTQFCFEQIAAGNNVSDEKNIANSVSAVHSMKTVSQNANQENIQHFEQKSPQTIRQNFDSAQNSGVNGVNAEGAESRKIENILTVFGMPASLYYLQRLGHSGREVYSKTPLTFENAALFLQKYPISAVWRESDSQSVLLACRYKIREFNTNKNYSVSFSSDVRFDRLTSVENKAKSEEKTNQSLKELEEILRALIVLLEQRTPIDGSASEKSSISLSGKSILSGLESASSELSGESLPKLDKNGGNLNPTASAKTMLVYLLTAQGRRTEVFELLKGIQGSDRTALLTALQGLSQMTAETPQMNTESDSNKLELAEIRQEILQPILADLSKYSRTEQSEILRLSAEVFADLGQAQQALQTFAQALKNDPKNTRLLIGLAELLDTQNDPAALKKSLNIWRLAEENSLENSADWFLAKEKIIRLYDRLGDKKQALKMLRLFELTHPDWATPEQKARMQDFRRHF